MSETLNHSTTYKLVRNFVIGLLLISLATIIINILIAQDAYTIAELSTQVKTLTETANLNQSQVNALASPEILSQKAEALGMLTSTTSQIQLIALK